jgi:anaerobic selenocysteine-containing dehydrogenase
MSLTQTIKSTCGFCSIGCGIKVYIRENNILKIEGDSDNPLNKGALCPKGLASLEYLHHPDRLQVPLKRKGKRGSGKWEQTSWEEALETIALHLTKTKNQFGPETVAFIHGAAKGLQDSYLARFAYAFGSPNIGWQGHVCFVPRMSASKFTYGFYCVPDFDYPPSCIIVWGKNMSATLYHGYKRVIKALQKGSKLIVVDPRQINLAKKADIWMQVKPGSDLALALGMIHVILKENLYDKKFVETWTIGFNFLQDSVKNYTPKKIEAITWVPAKKIEESARLYATLKPAVIQWGNAIDIGINSFQTARAICILRAITGNIGIPGGEIQPVSIPLQGRRSPELEGWEKMPPDGFKKSLNKKLKLLPVIKYVQPQSIVKAIIDKDPYAIHTAYIQGANPLLSYSNAQKVYEAFKKLNFLAVADMFMTPTAEMADIVLPAASHLEFDSIVSPPYSYPVMSIQQKVIRTGQCLSDYNILARLAKKTGLNDIFWETEEECLDFCLEPAGLTFEEFRKIGILPGKKGFRRYEKNGFSTPSGKIELFSNRLLEWGFDSIPKLKAPHDTLSSKSNMSDKYNLILTSWKQTPYHHSGGRQIASLRKIHPEPLVWINPKTASKQGIKDGDWIYIETKNGRILQKAFLTSDIDVRIIGVDYGWWFPETGPQNLYDWKKANINILTSDIPPFDPELRTSNLRGIRCKIFKKEEDLTKLKKI